MNLQEFAKLKIGDKIENPLTHSTGEVVETSDGGVRVVWGTAPGHPTKFFYSVMGTAWFGWNKIEAPAADNA